jgi:hypothetical protein
LDGFSGIHGLRCVHADQPYALRTGDRWIDFDGVAVYDPLDGRSLRCLSKGRGRKR